MCEATCWLHPASREPDAAIAQRQVDDGTSVAERRDGHCVAATGNAIRFTYSRFAWVFRAFTTVVSMMLQAR